MEQSGFKPEANADGEFKPLVGTYVCEWKVLRPEVDAKNGEAPYYQAEFKVLEVLAGDPAKDSDFNDFRKRYYVDWNSTDEKQAENLKKLANDVFTGTGLELPMKQAGFEAGFADVVGKKVYIRAWGWKRDDGKTAQMFVVQKPEVAEKKRSQDSLAF
jgi:hypothetical protein